MEAFDDDTDEDVMKTVMDLLSVDYKPPPVDSLSLAHEEVGNVASKAEVTDAKVAKPKEVRVRARRRKPGPKKGVSVPPMKVRTIVYECPPPQYDFIYEPLIVRWKLWRRSEVRRPTA